MKQLFITVSCLLLFAAVGYAQQIEPRCGLDQMLRSPMGQQLMKDEWKQEIRVFWDCRNASLIILIMLGVLSPESRTALGVSDECKQQIVSAYENAMKAVNDNPNVQKLIEEMETMQDGIELLASEDQIEVLNKVMEIGDKLTSLAMDLTSEAMDSVLPPELKQKIQESLLASMVEMPIISLYAFEALNLTDAQKQRMAEIKQEVTPEFESTLEKHVQAHVTLTNKFLAAIDKQIDTTNIIDIEGAREKLATENPEYKRIQDEAITGSRAFTTQFKTKVFDVLTDEQWVRLQDLIDHPSEHAKIFREQLREHRNERRQFALWLPSADLWKPSGAIFEMYRSERNTRSQLPRGEEVRR